VKKPKSLSKTLFLKKKPGIQKLEHFCEEIEKSE
jgi:hypothetical protein